MADYCKECSTNIFGADYCDLAGISTEEQTMNGLYPVVICEGCGIVQVDHTGKCVSTDCGRRDHYAE